MTHRIKDGWRLYYSEEGYPYYYNEMTGESEWADVSGTTDFVQQQHEQQQHELHRQSEAATEYDSMPLDSTERDEYGDADEESGQSTASSDSVFDQAFNEKFKAFLRTPEGMKAMLAEQERIEKFVERKARKQKEEKEKEFLRTTLINKKDDDSVKRNGAAGMWDAFGTFLGLRDPPSPARNKGSKEGSKVNKEKFDEFGRETKQRSRSKQHQFQSSQLKALATSQEEDLEGKASPALSPSSSSSDLESLSSSDSDVEVINAPVLSELPAWLRMEALYSRIVVPVQDFLHRHGVISASSVIGEYVSSAGYQVASTVGQRSFSAAQQGAVLAGSTLIEWTAMAWQNVQPYIVHFMENVIDTPISNAVSTNRTASTKSSLETSSYPDVESSAPNDEVESGRVSDQTEGKRAASAPYAAPQEPLPSLVSRNSNLRPSDNGLRPSALTISPRPPQARPPMPSHSLSIVSPRLADLQTVPSEAEAARESSSDLPADPGQREGLESELAPEAIMVEVIARGEETASTASTVEEVQVPVPDTAAESAPVAGEGNSETLSSARVASPPQDE